MSRQKNGGRPDGWQPMARAEKVPPPPERIAALRARGLSDDDIAHLLEGEVWKNNIYTVIVQRHPDGWITELSIRRNDRKAAHDWRHFQRIKSEIAGRHVEAIELYPDEDRLMDTANQYYLWVAPPGQRIEAGYNAPRNVVDADGNNDLGSVQRPLPDDWKDQ